MPQKTLSLILSGRSDANINFNEMLALLRSLGLSSEYVAVITSSRGPVIEIINLQPKGAKAKVYQVRQVRNLIIKYKLGGDS